MFRIVDNPAPRLIVPAQPTLSSHGVVGDGQTPGKHRHSRGQQTLPTLFLSLLGWRALMETLVQTSPQVDTSQSLLVVRGDDGVPEPLERHGVLEVELLPAVESGHLIVGPGGGQGARHAEQLVEVRGGGAHHVH